jgi:cell division GTPase FtsZ
MKDAGSALMGIGRASGEGRATEAAREAIASPLLEVNISGAQGVLFNITGGSDLGLYEVDEAAEIIRATADPEANIIFGTVIDERMGDEIAITVIATGFDSSRKRDVARQHTQMPVEMASELRVARERGQSRDLEFEDRIPAAVAVPIAVTSEAEQLPSAALVQPRSNGDVRTDPRRGPQNEIEDLDIPAFLRRHR